MTSKKDHKTLPGKRFRFIGLRGKLLMVTLTLFILPVAGLSYLQELEIFLKNSHAQSVLVIAKTVASTFQDNGSLITQNQISRSPQQAIYCQPLEHKIVIDGYGDDWFTLQNTHLPSHGKPQQSDDKLSVFCANNEQFYYFLINVNTDRTRHSNSFGRVADSTPGQPDFIHFQYLDYGRQVMDYRFILNSPGWVIGYPVNPPGSDTAYNIRGEWQENSQGYNLEFKIPVNRINRHIALQLKPNNAGASNEMISTATALSATQPLNPLISTDPLNHLRLQQLVPENSRMWLLNNNHYVNAHSDATQHHTSRAGNNLSLLSLYRRLYLLIMDFPEQPLHHAINQSRIDNDAVQATLEGQSTSRWLDNPHSDRLTLQVTTPVFDTGKNIIGTLVLEQDNNSVLALQDQTFERILVLTIILFIGIALSLLFFSTRLLKRIIKLRNDTEQALSQDGLIKNQLFRNDNDEIGDLARSFSTLLAQVEENNRYLKSLSGKLSHELRTPLTIISSSLENMSSQSMSADNQKYSLRARDGCSRLNELLMRMSEASRLEQSINSMEKDNIDIVQFLNDYVAAIQTSNAEIDFRFFSSLNSEVLEFSPELLAQLLDKLITNAISFHTDGTPIRLTLNQAGSRIAITVQNIGPLIDESKLGTIFSSLTSYRDNKGQEVHLGLGLYIASLIGKFHHGELLAQNNDDSQSVSFILYLPINPQT